MTRTRAPRCAGFSLLEMLTTVAIVLSLLTLAAPVMAEFMISLRLRGSAEAMLSALNLGRATAAQHNSRVVLCKSADGNRCSDTLGWDQGWLVFYDNNNSATREDGEKVLYRQEALSGRVTMNGNTLVEHYVSFTAYGQPKLPNGLVQNGTIAVCSATAGYSGGYAVVLARTGRARMAKATTEQCRQTSG